MTNFFKENWFKNNKYIILTILVLGLYFYWYEWRPVHIKKACYQIARESTLERGVIVNSENYFNGAYEMCLKEKGL